MDPERALMALGLQSVHAVELSGQLTEALGLVVPATFSFSHPTVAAMTDELVRQVAPEATPREWGAAVAGATAGRRADRANAGGPPTTLFFAAYSFPSASDRATSGEASLQRGRAAHAEIEMASGNQSIESDLIYSFPIINRVEFTMSGH